MNTNTYADRMCYSNINIYHMFIQDSKQIRIIATYLSLLIKQRLLLVVRRRRFCKKVANLKNDLFLKKDPAVYIIQPTTAGKGRADAWLVVWAADPAVGQTDHVGVARG